MWHAVTGRHSAHLLAGSQGHTRDLSGAGAGERRGRPPGRAAVGSAPESERWLLDRAGLRGGCGRGLGGGTYRKTTV